MVRHNGQPAYLQIADDLRAQIRGGSLAPGAPLPSTTKLAEQYDASLSVVKLAVGVLRTEGLVIGQQGKGVFVRDAEEPPAAADSTSEVAELRAAVQDLSVRLAKVEEQLATSTTRRPGRSSR
ncbi:winged helix-turn-helix domain-containing protein [Nonomuraea sp. LP-02]|uniref:winged helix-turn-helix domain-containing protein n=1 Tax=Nonomuraea sp. LP-02 TaxID=3097960 RepID=UPI002E37E5CD|nr:winged helix-turn-helix domain-containing protein [Nonomuraea sp. LP-02]MED7926244.1 winged helix-turn-helix domain-containing protein [Nonomuraea sp. LP-02]